MIFIQDILRFLGFICLGKHLVGIRKPVITKLLVQWIILTTFISSCESDPYGSSWDNEESFSISQYLDKNQAEYSKFYKLMAEGKMLNTLYAYNPYGNDYTLFLPTNEGIDHFIQQNQNYENFEELVKDTSFIKILTRYHTVNEKIHTDEFPDGALNDTTLTGDRLVTSFFSDGNNQLIKVNNSAPITSSNLKMTNGYIHVISRVLQKNEVSGYDWIQQQEDYSILAEAIRRSGLQSRLWWNKYTILAEHDSIYHRNGIYNIEDLIARIATPGMSLSNRNNTFYLFAAYHFVGGEYYMNDFSWGNKKYTTLATGKLLTIETGAEIKINPGIDNYGYRISESGDTTLMDYILPVWEKCNVMTRTGAIHSISDVLFFETLPEN
ncbi:fasciclin domain-containing protein [Mariniphaga sp.]|uniref:fasciclin domain-containing protein n=1 Tax=Mariniphaga sp. TaxID=1954475 RepID=UPI0035663C24